MSEQFEKIGQRIRARRKALDMSQAELAELLEISNNHMSSIGNGKHSTKLETFLKLCDCLKTTPNHLLLGCMYPQNAPKNIIDTISVCDEELALKLSDMRKEMTEKVLAKNKKFEEEFSYKI